MLLADREAWSEGRYLMADIDGALGRRSATHNTEVDTIVALFSADALLPNDGGDTVLEGLVDKSRRQAVGVSKDLRGRVAPVGGVAGQRGAVSPG